MEENNIMVNEEVIEATEEIATSGSGKGLKVAATVGGVLLAGGLAYKFIIKPIVAKVKAKKEQKAMDAAIENGIEYDNVFEPEDETEE